MNHQAYADHKAMLTALEAGTASPEQQRAAFAHLQAIKRQHNADMREAERDAHKLAFENARLCREVERLQGLLNAAHQIMGELARPSGI